MKKIIKSFTLKKVHGYKTLKMRFPYKSSVFISPNGVGKTTLLNAMYAILSGKMWRLSEIDFETAELDFENETLILDKSKVCPFSKDYNAFSDLRTIERKFLEKVINENPKNLRIPKNVSNEEMIYRYDRFYRILKPVVKHEFKIHRIIDMLEKQSYSPDYFNEFFKKVKKQMNDVEVLYLPTYRRIEESFPTVVSRNEDDYPNGQLQNNSAGIELIKFGMSDVQTTFVDILENIKRETRNGHEKFISTICDKLINPNKQCIATTSIDPEKVHISLSRLETPPQLTIHDLEGVIKNATSNENGGNDQVLLLNYFLMLMETYAVTLSKEESIDKFVNTINGYFKEAGAAKEMLFDRSSLKISVSEVGARTPIDLNSLSSGEQQIISIFATLNFKEKQFFILIDEPEISLSVEWQRKFLPDIVDSENCVQLISITHSPFIFDNCLDEFTAVLTCDGEG